MKVDCEGFRGASQPLANSLEDHLKQLGRPDSPSAQRYSSNQDRLRRISRKVAQLPSRRSSSASEMRREVIPLAQMTVSSPSDQTQQEVEQDLSSLVVENIYPRFLYIFSDVVCYVTASSKCALQWRGCKYANLV